MPFDAALGPAADLLMAARLQACSLDWSDQARRLRLMVRSAAVGGPCGQALVACGDAVAAEMASVATDLAALGSLRPSGLLGSRLWAPLARAR